MDAIDLNADVGEGYGAWAAGCDEAVVPLVSSVNVACGYHAGDPSTMARTIALAKASGAAAGAHPGYPDLAGFGRRSIALSGDEAYGAVLYQVGALAAFARAAGVELSHLKPHGALYNDAASDLGLARAVARAARDAGGLRLVGPPGSRLEEAAAELGLPFAREFFADRAYGADGRLVPRSVSGAVIRDAGAVAARTLRALSEGMVEALGGGGVPIAFDTICLHGDSPEAVALARSLGEALRQAGIALRPLPPARP